MKIGETGVTFRVNAGFDMSSYTELSIIFIKPDNTTITKTTADGVTLGTGAVTDDKTPFATMDIFHSEQP